MSHPILSPDHPAMRAIGAALTVAETWGSVEGGHHKMWVIDQMVRALAGVDYDDWVTAYNADDEYDEWQTGIAP